MTTTLRGRAGPALLLAALLIVATATDAAAHTVWEPDPEAFVYQQEPYCTEAYAEISHGTGNGYQKAKVMSWQYYYYSGLGSPDDCFLSYNRQPGELRVTWELWIYNDPGPQWRLCHSLGYWAENTTTTSTLTRWVAYPAGPGGAPCGINPAFGNWFATVGQGYVKRDSTWYGGGTVSGYHWLPTSPS